jgi:anaerobic selenocysteine-containing dehydrogenase
MYHWDPAVGLVKADRGNMLLHGREIALGGSYRVVLHDGTEVEVEPALQVLRRMLDAQYTPEQQQAITTVHPDVVRSLARKAARSRTNIMLGWNSCKYYHGDLIERAMCLLLAVTGNWGKHGTGIRSWTAGMFDGQGLASSKAAPGIEGTEQLLSLRDMAVAAIKAADPSITSDELAIRELHRQLADATEGGGSATRGAAGSTMSPMAFWWYFQAGYDERWNHEGWGDDSLPRGFDEYFQEALDNGWWKGQDQPRPEQPPRVLIECGGNMFRRTRGGRTALLDTLWPKLSTIVTIDFRMSSTALWADVILPAAQHYEKVSYHIPTPHVMHLTFSDRAATPAGEAKPEWEIYQILLEKLAERAAARGVESYTNARGREFRFDDAWDRFTLGGYFADEDRMADEIVRDCVYAGTLPEGTSLATMREKGHVRFIDWGMMPMALAQASPFEKERTHTPFRDHVEFGSPFPTYARRAQFLIDHPWWLEAHEELPVHKPNPKAGGDHPLRMTSGHNRWSIHSMNQANPVMLQTHRGEPLVEISVEDAAARSVGDDDLIRVWNDIAAFTCRAKVAPGVMPGQIISYNGWDGHQYRDWMGANEIEAGMVKWIAFAGGYGHIQYTENEWQPVPTDRGVPCDFEKLMEV